MNMSLKTIQNMLMCTVDASRNCAALFFVMTILWADAADSVVDPGWPREYTKDGAKMLLYQPQVDSWEDYGTLTMRAAISVLPKGAKDPVFGALYVKAATKTDMETRTVLIKDIEVTSLRFPNLNDAEADKLTGLVKDSLPTSEVVALDRVLAYLDESNQEVRSIEVNLDPPPIYLSQTPAVLMIFMGEPKLEAVEGTKLLFAVNTNWDVFFDMTTSQYYLLLEDGWLQSDDVIQGPWTSVTTLPTDLSSLPEDLNWEEVRKHIPGKPVTNPPRIFATSEPSELIVIDGQPSFSPIPGTSILYVNNTESDLFLHSPDAHYYLLTAGRWFKTPALDGEWKAATLNLPPDFANISPDHSKGYVLSSVQDSPQAQDAVLLASIPETTTIKRSEAKVTVVYEDDPVFVFIDDTSVSYAVNSPNDVFLVNKKYYCCYQGVWFESSNSKGPREVCTAVPAAIYTIPPTSPKYNVTYVTVNNYDPATDTVQASQTSGYKGQYVAAGLLMFGLGYALGNDHDDYYHYSHYHYHSHYYSYGSAVRYDYHHGGYYRSANIYGPYGGAGRSASYNPSTGTYGRSAYRYGPSGSAYGQSAYNPYTNSYGARANVNTAHGSWGRAVVGDENDWAQAGHRSTRQGTVAAFETSEGAAGVASRGRYGSSAVVRDSDGDVYVGRDGNVYKHDDDGGWQSRENGGWEDTNSSRSATSITRTNTSTATKTQTTTRSTPTKSTTSTRTPTSTRAPSSADVQSQLSQDASARLRGNANASSVQSRSFSQRGSASGRSGGGVRGRR